MDDVILTAEQEAEAEQILDILLAGARVELKAVARLLASKSDGELLGETEFAVRERVLRLGARGLDAALEGRKKGGAAGRAASARTARKTRNSKATDPAP